MPSPPIEDLLTRIAEVTAAEGLQWLRSEIESIEGGASPARLARAFSSAPRRLGSAVLGTGHLLFTQLGPITTERWGADEAARVALLIAAATAGSADTPDGSSSQQVPAGLERLYRAADSREKSAIARALPFFASVALLPLALDIGRTNEVPLFSALALDNPFPAAFYPELEFNKLVLKVEYLNLPLQKVLGLEQRKTPELARMALDHIRQQRAANRAFSPELEALAGAAHSLSSPDEL